MLLDAAASEALDEGSHDIIVNRGLFNITDHDRNFAKFKIQDEYGLLSFGDENTFETGIGKSIWFNTCQ